MRYEELILKFDRGDISQAELDELLALMESKNLESDNDLELEPELNKMDYSLSSKNEDYLASFGLTFINDKFPDASTGGNTSLNTNHSQNISKFGNISTNKIISIAALGVSIAVVSILYFNQPNTSIQTEHQTINNEQSGIQNNPSSEPTNIINEGELDQAIESISNNNSELISEKSTPKAKNPSIENINQNKNIQSQSEANAKIIADNSALNNLIAQNQQLLKAAEQKNDIASQMLYNRKLGVIYRDLPNQLGDSKTFFLKALSQSKQIKNSEMEAELLGELGLCELKAGNQYAANELIDNCIEQLKKSNSPLVGLWMKKKQSLFKW